MVKRYEGDSVCSKERALLNKLVRDGHFNFSGKNITVEDLYSKYPVGNAADKNFKSYIDELELCPQCRKNNVGDKYDFYPTRHYHKCADCGWQSKWFKGDSFNELKSSKKDEIEVE